LQRNGIEWGARHKTLRLVAMIAVVAVAFALQGTSRAEPGPGSGSGPGSAGSAHYIVRLVAGATVDQGQLVSSVGGQFDQALPTINGFSAWLPNDRTNELEGNPSVAEVSADTGLNVQPSDPVAGSSHDAPGFVAGDFGRREGGRSFARLDGDAVKRIIGADDVQKDGITGAGVDVALIDTGVAPVAGVGRVVNGPDLSFDSQVPGFQYLDGYGHGTHLAGIINGRGSGVSGVAPGSRVVNVKVGAANGAVDVSQVIAAIDWVVQHRNDNGLNIRVITLAYGTDSTQPYTIDPLAYAIEVAWRKGITVVVAAGNRGATMLDNPATDPFVIAVGAAQANGTYNTGDDDVAPFSSIGNANRGPDVVAPGRSVVSLRVPNSYVDLLHPEGREPDGLLRGSGTSQAAAVVAGSVALMLQAQPNLTPDQVKWLLRRTAQKLPFATAQEQGAGEINVRKAAKRDTGADRAMQSYPYSTGTGSLEAARGSVHVALDGVVLSGEIDIFGTPWNGQSWSGQSWSGQSWSGGLWNGQSWSGQSWSGQSWSGQSWSGQSWSGQSWSGQSWSGQSWSGQSWSGQSWSGQSWSGVAWSGQSWSGQSWSGS
jgi:serine protease AprX